MVIGLDIGRKLELSKEKVYLCGYIYFKLTEAI